MKRGARRRVAGLVASVATACGVAGATLAPVGSVAAQTDPEQELVERYAPIIELVAQSARCATDGEPYAPTSVDIMLDNPDVLLRQVGSGNPVLMAAPGAADLFGLSEGFYLDAPGGALEPDCIYEQDFDRYSGTITGERETVVYAHIATQDDEPDKLAVQYWFYWYYNDWNNKHEGDWEGIQLLFDVGTVDEALRTAPVSVGYAQHEGGERAGWDDDKLEREGDRPVVYPSAGSHASYYGSALYIGRSASEGFGCDTTDGPTVRTDPEVILLPDSVDDPTSPLAWLAFGGRWGERQNGPFNGPTGPLDKERWHQPVDWHDGLRSGSVVVPTGDSQADAIVNTFCSAVETGSNVLIRLKTSPATLLIALAVVVVVARWLIGRTAWGVVAPLPLVARRRAGEIIRATARSYGHRWRVLLTIGLVYLPVGAVISGLIVFARALPVVGRTLDLATNAQDASMVFAILAGSFANLVAFVAVNAMVASYYDALTDDPDATGMDAVRRAGGHTGELLVGFLISTAVVAVLLVSVIGIPIALWLLVRFQFMAQAVVIEDRTGWSALRRSAELVRGRWFHTALMVAMFNALAGAAGLLVGLVVLIVAAGIPMWLFSAIITLVYALIAPLTAVAMTLLFGDAVAEQHDPAATRDTRDTPDTSDAPAPAPA